MNAEVRQIKTNAELALAQAYSAEKARLPGDRKVVALRDAAAARFDALGLPHRRVEEWKYTDLRALIREAKPIAGAPNAAGKARAKDAGKVIGDMDARRVVFVDGTFVPELSDLANLSPGLTIRSMAQALAEGDALVADRLGKVMPADGEGVIALNTALMRDGAVIHVAKGATLERPIHLVFAATGDKAASVFTRSLVVIEQGARAMVVESHDASAGHQVNTALELVVGDNAHVDHIKITSGPSDLVHVSSLMAAIGANARFNDFAFNIGGGVVRNQTFVRFDGEGTHAGLRGASLLKGKQHIEQKNYPFPVLFDETRQVTRTYGVYHAFALDAYNIARPATFVIGPEGTICWIAVSPSQRERPRLEDVFDLYTKMVLGMAVVFQMPTVVFFLSKLGRLRFQTCELAINAIENPNNEGEQRSRPKIPASIKQRHA